MRKINTIGIQQANKVMLLAAVAYNLKKYLKFVSKSTQTKAKEVKASLDLFFECMSTKKMRFELFIYWLKSVALKNERAMKGLKWGHFLFVCGVVQRLPMLWL